VLVGNGVSVSAPVSAAIVATGDAPSSAWARTAVGAIRTIASSSVAIVRWAKQWVEKQGRCTTGPLTGTFQRPCRQNASELIIAPTTPVTP
jgi:hypothetical protein